MRTVIVLLLWLLISATTSPPQPAGIIGRASTATIPTVQVIIIVGQSNASGRAEVARLANTNYNYVGVGTGYPAVRNGQAQYVASPAGIFTYFKGENRTSNHLAADNGSWEAYQAGVNSSFDESSSVNHFGIELSLSQRIRSQTGQEVFVVKCAIGGTALTTGSNIDPIGDWNCSIRSIASEFFIRRAVRDLQTFRPNTRINLAGVVWWQGETDGSLSVPPATYKAEFYKMKAVLDRSIREVFNITKPPYLWNLIQLHHNLNAGETAINTALQEIDTEQPDCVVVPNSFPRKVDLTAQEASPVGVGSGSSDDTHMSYIGQLGQGEFVYTNILSRL